jgi:hypothetical protein
MFWVSRSMPGGSSQAQVGTLLHELAHLRSKIPSDANSQAQSLANSKTVYDNCKSTVRAAGAKNSGL